MHPLIGTSVTQTDPMDPARAAALAATLDVPAPAPGDPLPPFWHQVYFWDALPPGDLGRDGHPQTGGFIPDLGLPRRMWAGGRLTWHGPLVTGIQAQKTSVIENITQKTGRSGPLAFVTLRHDYSQQGGLRVVDWQDIVYRHDPAPDAPQPAAPRAPGGAEVTRPVTGNTTKLFRYSALTFNGHRIHYDLVYARSVEGYPGLIVHGPLLAQHLMDLAQDLLGGITWFRYRATAPLFHFETGQACAGAMADGALPLWVAGPDGRLCMDAEAG